MPVGITVKKQNLACNGQVARSAAWMRAACLGLGCAAVLAVSGCRSGPQTGGPQALEFSPPVAVPAAEPDLALLFQDRFLAATLEKDRILVSLGQGNGASWEKPAPIEASVVGSRAADYGTAVALDDRVCLMGISSGPADSFTMTTLTSPDGLKWTRSNQSVDPVKLDADERRDLHLTHAVAGKKRALALLKMDGANCVAMLTGDAESWEQVDVALPLPGGFRDWTLRPMQSHGNRHSLAIDGADRVHLLIGDAVVFKGDEEAEGLLYYRSEDGRNFEAEFLAGDHSSTGVGIGTNRSLPNEVYRCYAEDDLPSHQSSTGAAYEISMQASQDGGASWGRPFELHESSATMEHIRVAGFGQTIGVSWVEAGKLMICLTFDGGQAWSTPQTVFTEKEGQTHSLQDYRLVVFSDGATLLVDRPDSFGQPDGVLSLVGKRR